VGWEAGTLLSNISAERQLGACQLREQLDEGQVKRHEPSLPEEPVGSVNMPLAGLLDRDDRGGGPGLGLGFGGEWVSGEGGASSSFA
jgi:hypothetical protein